MIEKNKKIVKNKNRAKIVRENKLKKWKKSVIRAFQRFDTHVSECPPITLFS